MTPRQRVLAVLEGQRPDKVPVYHTGFCGAAGAAVLGREAFVGGGVQQWREARAWTEGESAVRDFIARSLEDARDLALATNQDVIRYEYWRLPEPPTEQIDDHTFLFGSRDGAYRIMQYDPETELFQIIEECSNNTPLSKEYLTLVVERLQQQTGIKTADLDVGRVRDVFNRFGREHLLRFSGASLGLPHDARWLEAMIVDPGLVGSYLDQQVQDALVNLEILARAGAKVVFGGGDLASQHGPLYSPALFRELVLPRLKQITASCDRLGLAYFFGSDGHLWAMAKELFHGSGVKGYYEVDGRAGMDLARLRAAFPDLVLFGNISSHTLQRGSTQQVVEETRRCVETAKTLGRIVVGCSNYVVPQTPEANLHAMLDTIEGFR